MVSCPILFPRRRLLVRQAEKFARKSPWTCPKEPDGMSPLIEDVTNALRGNQVRLNFASVQAIGKDIVPLCQFAGWRDREKTALSDKARFSIRCHDTKANPIEITSVQRICAINGMSRPNAHDSVCATGNP